MLTSEQVESVVRVLRDGDVSDFEGICKAAGVDPADLKAHSFMAITRRAFPKSTIIDAKWLTLWSGRNDRVFSSAVRYLRSGLESLEVLELVGVAAVGDGSYRVSVKWGSELLEWVESVDSIPQELVSQHDAEVVRVSRRRGLDAIRIFVKEFHEFRLSDY